jgi:hypothetical protein
VEALKNCYRRKDLSQSIRETAYQFVSKYSVSARDEHWKKMVADFLEAVDNPKVKIIDFQNSHPINEHRPRKSHRM